MVYHSYVHVGNSQGIGIIRVFTRGRYLAEGDFFHAYIQDSTMQVIAGRLEEESTTRSTGFWLDRDRRRYPDLPEHR